MSPRLISAFSRLAIASSLAILALAVGPAGGLARDFTFDNITDAPGGPGQGNAPDINAHGDVAFYRGTSVYFYDLSQDTCLNVTALPGAPATAWFPKLNNLGNIVMMDASNRDLWFFEAATQNFTNISALPGYPGNSQAHGMQIIFGLNDANQVSFHSGDNNWGRVYVYTRATGAFEEITGKPGGYWYGRQNAINNAGQVAYMGFPSLYVYDLNTGVTTNISTLPGGPGGLGDNFAFNDRGDAAIFRPDQITYYDASSGAFLYLASLPGFPAGAAATYGNDLSNRGEITFWRTDLYYFNPVDQSFTRLNNQGPMPVGGTEISINSRGRIALAAGLISSEDIYIATASPQSDFDADGDVDLHDFSMFQPCFAGAGQPVPGWPTCAADADYDGDDDVDQTDLTSFEAELAGPTH